GARHAQGQHPGRADPGPARRAGVLGAGHHGRGALGRADGGAFADARGRGGTGVGASGGPPAGPPLPPPGGPAHAGAPARGGGGAAGGLEVWGVLVVGLVDNVLRPILVGKDIRMPDYLVLVSTIGGLAVFGVNGFVLGPVIAALFLATWSLYARERAREDEEL